MKPFKTVFVCGLFAVALLVAPITTHAQDVRALEQLSDLNRINPKQNPAYETSDEILNRKILDRKNYVIGEVEDVTLRQNGTIVSIVSDLDRLRLGNTVHLDFREMRIQTLSDTYALAMEDDELKDFYPQLLANMETASGTEDDVLSTRNLIGSKIKAEDGRTLGEVQQVMFSSNGGRAAGLLIEVNIGTTRGEYVAIPFRTTKLTSEYSKITGTISNGMADAIIEVAKN